MSHPTAEANMIFFSPGRKGVLFSFPVDFFKQNDFIDETVDRLQSEVGAPVIWVEDRRNLPRA